MEYNLRDKEIDPANIMMYVGTVEKNGKYFRVFKYTDYVLGNVYAGEEDYFYVSNDNFNGQYKGKRIDRLNNVNGIDLKKGTLVAVVRSCYRDANLYYDYDAICTYETVNRARKLIENNYKGYYSLNDDSLEYLEEYHEEEKHDDKYYHDEKMYENIDPHAKGGIILNYVGWETIMGKNTRIFKVSDYRLGIEKNDLFYCDGVGTGIYIDRNKDCTNMAYPYNKSAIVSYHIDNAKKACKFGGYDPHTITDYQVERYMMETFGGEYISNGPDHFIKCK